jgi:hypothetical protein
MDAQVKQIFDEMIDCLDSHGVTAAQGLAVALLVAVNAGMRDGMTMDEFISTARGAWVYAEENNMNESNGDTNGGTNGEPQSD